MARLTFTVPEAAEMIGISRTSAYEAVRRGEIPSLAIGRRIVITRATLETLVGPLFAAPPSRDESAPDPELTSTRRRSKC
ncbi:MAG: helix-turn-helix domain-containing protein [Acidimicrobiales bacterium]